MSNAIKSNLYNNYTKLHGTHVLQIIFAVFKNALSADDRTKAQIESAKTRFRIHSNEHFKRKPTKLFCKVTTMFVAYCKNCIGARIRNRSNRGSSCRTSCFDGIMIEQVAIDSTKLADGGDGALIGQPPRRRSSVGSRAAVWPRSGEDDGAVQALGKLATHDVLKTTHLTITAPIFYLFATVQQCFVKRRLFCFPLPCNSVLVQRRLDAN